MIREISIAVLFAILTAIGAQITIRLSFSPVPVTLQVMMVIISGLVLGSRRGFASQVAYLAAGVMGLPVFSGGIGGPAALFGPTGGYLLVFPLAAFSAGWISERARLRNTTIGYLAASLSAIVVIYVGGVLWLAKWLGLGMNGVAFYKALILGAVPFIFADLVKAVSATLLVRTGHGTLWRFFGTMNSFR